MIELVWGWGDKNVKDYQRRAESPRCPKTRSSIGTGRKILIAASQVEFEEDRTRILLAAVEESWAQDGEDGHLYIKYRCVSADFIINERMLDLVDATGDRSLQCIVDMRTPLERFSGHMVRERVVPDPPQSAEGTGSEDAGAT